MKPYYCGVRDYVHKGHGDRKAQDLHICRAFPKGIPWAIVVGDVKHTSVLPGQVGDYVLTPGTEDLLPDPQNPGG
jgi:hypothetical protein